MAAHHTHASTRGIRLIADFEGFVGHPYQDPVGVWTIGYGHTKGVGPNSPHITKAEGFRLLKSEVNASYAPAVARLNLPLTQPMFDALTSFIYNVGSGAISPTTGIGSALRAHKWREAADHLLEWDRAGGRVLPGLLRRRQAERHLFLSRLPK